MRPAVEYFRIAEGEPLPDVAGYAPFKAVVVINDAYSPEWQTEASHWLVDGGCLFMMAWGEGCSGWDDSVDWANLEDFDFGEIPDHRFVLTSWHEDETLNEVFWFAHHAATAYKDSIGLDRTLILDIGKIDRCQEMLAQFDQAIREIPDEQPG